MSRPSRPRQARTASSEAPAVPIVPPEPLLPESYRRVFALTRRAAVSVLKRRLRTLELLRDALRVVARHPDPLSAAREDTTLFVRLVLAWHRRSYRSLPRRSLVVIVAALIYLVYPFDALVDGLPFIGYVDDTTILAAVVHALRSELDRFRLWERTVAPGATRASPPPAP